LVASLAAVALLQVRHLALHLVNYDLQAVGCCASLPSPWSIACFLVMFALLPTGRHFQQLADVSKAGSQLTNSFIAVLSSHLTKPAHSKAACKHCE
jgi:hypothetical protein